MMDVPSDEEGDTTSVDLGFLEKSAPWRLKSEFFRSKVGGKPSWLNLSEIPTSDMVTCGHCQGPCIFLCQVYAPIEDQDSCFHRTLFIFMCPSAECCRENDSASFKVLRCQLSRRNQFYFYDAPIESEDFKPEVTAESFGKLCCVCNLKGVSHCGKCRVVNYCSRQHQVADWKAGHKSECCSAGGTEYTLPLLLPEWELVTEPEPDVTAEPKQEKSNEEQLREFQELVQSGQAGSLHGDAAAEAELQSMPEGQDDATFKKFKQRVSRSPTQVLRFEREGQTLWVSDLNQPEQMPPCSHCGSPRVFEFQVLPQMLNSLGLDTVGQSIDWGTLAVFTCQQSCSEGPAYKQEIIVKQDFIK
ncbi:hypothetical protein B566_EDAN001887 [Ephemera danica]|nr:hypothetical protein B566_EDAN001887 [Ephemera danica]